MDITAKHAEDRAWAFLGLEELEGFLNDPDFEGDLEEEKTAIDRKRKELKDGKYRVVFIGAFNVGKSALVNAFLGNEYLPMVLEECTTKITHVLKGDTMRMELRLASSSTEMEVQTLIDLVQASGVNAAVTATDDGETVIVEFETSNPRDLLKTLRPLVTMSADEDYPQLKSFRIKFDEIFIYLPTDLLEEDIAFVDSPGVHSISETNTKIAQEIIPNSHLVVCLLDSQNAGNWQNREFIEGVVKHRHRKLLFVINKADQLNPDEIDPKGRRGPAKDLIRSLEGIVDSPEIFFVSALYALVSSQLTHFQLLLPDIDQNNKIKIPWAVQSELMQAEEPTKAVADYLMARSNLDALKSRLLDYLYKENREGAILESVCRFLDGQAYKYARPIQIKIDMARDIPRLDELGQMRQVLTADLEDHQRRLAKSRDAITTMASGGSLDGVDYAGYEALLAERFTDSVIEVNLLRPMREWLAKNDNLKKAKRAGYTPLVKELERVLDGFLDELYQESNRELNAVEQYVLSRASKVRDSIALPDRTYVQPARGPVGSLSASLAGSYAGFAIAGAVLGGIAGYGALLGGALGTFADMPSAAAAGAGGGAVALGILGIVARGMTGKRVRMDRLNRQIAEKVKQILLGGAKDAKGQSVAAIRDQLRDMLSTRRSALAENVEKAFEKAISALQTQLDAVVEEEEGIKERQQAILSRLEPKVEKLAALGQRAMAIAEVNAAEEIVIES